MLLKLEGRSKIGAAPSPRERGPDLSPRPYTPEVGAVIPAMNCDIHWASPTRKRIIFGLTYLADFESTRSHLRF
jgi:hypothetical protein